MSFMRMLREGPDVSLSGSPIVSPMTAALCASGPRARAASVAPASMYFFALSHAPPVLDMLTASSTPSALTPKRVPTMMGVPMTRMPGPTISRREACVEIDAVAVVGPPRALHDARDGVELVADLLHHGQRRLADALHGLGREPEWEHGPHEQAGEDL